jgi:hypothetical protein
MKLGITALATGLALYVAAAAVRLGPYRNDAQPGWLTSLWLVATALVVVGLLVMMNTAVRVYRERS